MRPGSTGVSLGATGTNIVFDPPVSPLREPSVREASIVRRNGYRRSEPCPVPLQPAVLPPPAGELRYVAPVNDCVSAALTRAMVLEKANVSAVARLSPNRPLPLPARSAAATAAAADGDSGIGRDAVAKAAALTYRTSSQQMDAAVQKLHGTSFTGAISGVGSPTRATQCGKWYGRASGFSRDNRPLHLRWQHGGEAAHARKLVVDTMKPASSSATSTGPSASGVWGCASSGPYAMMNASF